MISFFKNFVYPISVLVGTIIGVGFFALPYLTLKVGLWPMVGYFIVLGSFITAIHYLFGELVLITPDRKRLPGFAKLYLGAGAEKFVIFSTIIGIFGGILAYCVVGGTFLAGMLSPILGGTTLLYTLLYFFLGSFLIFFGISIITKIEFWGIVLRLVILAALFFKGRAVLHTSNLMVAPNLSQLFLPYGVLLFSLWGADLIPEIEEMLGEKKKLLRIIIPVSLLIAMVVYGFFIYLILGISGTHTTQEALVGLKDVLGPSVVTLALIFGLVTTFSAFITLGLTLKKIFWYDLKINEKAAWFITFVPPLLLLLAGANNFIAIISFAGGIMLGFNGILILLMYWRATKKTFVFPLILIFLLGIVYEIRYFVK